MVNFTERQVLERIDEWISKANNERSPFNRFISLWIAYNMAYGLYSKRVKPRESTTHNDSEKAIRTKCLLHSSTVLQNTLETYLPELYERSLVFSDEYWRGDDDKRSLRERIGPTISPNDYEIQLDALLKLLYKYRCNLFHGEKSFYNNNQHQLLSTCNKIIASILHETVRLFQISFSD